MKKIASMPEINSSVDLDSLVGVWRYESNDTVFRIKFKKELYNDLYWMLTGTYEFLPDSTNNPSNDIETDEIRIYAKNYNPSEEGVLQLTFRDRIKKHNHGAGVRWGKITKIAPNKIHWDLRIRRDERHLIKHKFSVPSNVIMTKE